MKVIARPGNERNAIIQLVFESPTPCSPCQPSLSSVRNKKYEYIKCSKETIRNKQMLYILYSPRIFVNV